jgi:hypothetical protein
MVSKATGNLLQLSQGQLQAHCTAPREPLLYNAIVFLFIMLYFSIAGQQILLLAMQSGDVFYSMQSRTTRPAAKTPPSPVPPEPGPQHPMESKPTARRASRTRSRGPSQLYPV